MIVERVLQNFPRAVLKVHPNDRLAQVAGQFEKKHIGIAMVCDEEDQLVGVLTLGDIVHSIGERGAEAINLPVRMLMTSDVTVCDHKDDIEVAVKKMAEHNVRHMPVVDGGKLVGLVEKEDALQVLYDLAALDFAQLRNYVFKVSGRY